MALKRGDMGTSVSEIQVLLNGFGEALKVDGDFGAKTEAAVKEFQETNGLSVTGVVDDVTWAELTDSPDKRDAYEQDGDDPSEAVIELSGTPSKHTWLFDNGHGGMINGVYQTVGKQSPQVPPGIYEGEFNRDIVKRLVGLCGHHGIDCVDLVPEQTNISLDERIRRANEIHRAKQNCIFISIHANAHTNGWSSARGIGTFFWAGSSAKPKKEKAMANELQQQLLEYSKLKNRYAREKSYKVLRKTSMPAFLTENGFMTHREEAALLATDAFRTNIARAHFEFIRSVERDG